MIVMLSLGFRRIVAETCELEDSAGNLKWESLNAGLAMLGSEVWS
jgi:hypothetical protein